MATGKITLTSLRGLEGWLWDSSVNGFGARKQTQGTFYYLRYRQGGRQMMRSIGRHGSPWTPDSARAEALRLLGALVSGANPFSPILKGETFGVCAKRYLDHKQSVMRPRAFEQVQLHLLRRASALASIPLAQIDRRKIAALLAEANGPTARNRQRSTLSAFFAWCIAEGLLDSNPISGTSKATENNGRERVLTNDEIRQLWHACDNRDFGRIVRLLLLTGQRRGEIGGLRWSEITADSIVLPAARAKNHREHLVPLSTQAHAILPARRDSTPFVFAREGFKDWAKAKSKLNDGLKPWTIHDLRRTAATHMSELGVLPHIVEATLNHQSGHKAGVAGVYNKARYADEIRAALQIWADHIDQITK